MSYYCKQCNTNIPRDKFEEYEGIDGWMFHCPVCNDYIKTEPYAKPNVDLELTSDELRYAIYGLGKQMKALDTKRKTLYGAIAKLEIMLEIALENNQEEEDGTDC